MIDMPGKQAKILSEFHLKDLLIYASATRNPKRNRAIVLLSVKAGLRAGEIAKLAWNMVLGPNGDVGDIIELHDRAAKKKSGRRIPIHVDLREALEALLEVSDGEGPCIKSERGGAMKPLSVVIWFASAYHALNLEGCSSHSGRRTFITRAARVVHKAGGSLRDVQLLAGHRSIQTTERYIDGDTDAQRKLISLI
jgi:integrase